MTLKNRVKKLMEKDARMPGFMMCGVDSKGTILKTEGGEQARKWIGRNVDEVPFPMKVFLIGESNTPQGERPWDPWLDDVGGELHA